MQSMKSGLAGIAAKAQHNALLAVLGLLALGAVVMLVRHSSGKLASSFGHRIDAFKKGFRTIRNARAFVLVALISLVTWYAIAAAYLQVLHAYRPTEYTVTLPNGDSQQLTAHADRMKMEDVLLLMGGSMFGSVVQLPGGVGGSQLAVISVLSSNVFSVEPYNITRELAVSCGIMLWLVTFMSVIPAGVLLARFEKLSFLRLSEESSQEEEEIEAEATPLAGSAAADTIGSSTIKR
jgi:hypothetical protein